MIISNKMKLLPIRFLGLSSLSIWSIKFRAYQQQCSLFEYSMSLHFMFQTQNYWLS